MSKLQSILEDVGAALKAIDDLVSEMDEVSALELSTYYQAAKEAADTLEAAYKNEHAEMQAIIQADQKRAKPVRDCAKNTLSVLGETLEAVYRLEEQTLREKRDEALMNGDTEALATIPEAPELAEGLGFAELQDFEVVDLDKVPKQFLKVTVDNKAIKDALKKGSVPGVTAVTKLSWRKAQPIKENAE